ncbi:MAG: hypothetical protein D4R45_01170 [Planctomycetaceae bacterium]|nr:MAG: hypothetical protein D4R45_01170 [Planctomycetaceae bacterium]
MKKFLPLINKFKIDFIWNTGSLVILGLSGIVINTLIARYLGAVALGVFTQVVAIYYVLSQFSVGGIHYSALKHVSYNQENRDRIGEIAVSAVVLSGALASIFAVLTFALRNIVGDLLNSPGVAVGLGLTAPGLIAFALNKVLLNVLNGVSHMRAYAIFQSLRFILILCGVVFVIVLSFPANYLAGSVTFSEIVLLFVLLVYVHRKVAPLKIKAASSGWYSEHISFGSRGFLSGVLVQINTRIDVLTLGYFLSDTIVGVYSFAAILAEGFGQISIVVRRNVDPLLGTCFSKKNFLQIEQYSKKIKRVFFPLMIGVSVVAALLYPVGLKIFVADVEFKQSWYVFVILMAGVAINACYGHFSG